jgi:hypothetical protein
VWENFVKHTNTHPLLPYFSAVLRDEAAIATIVPLRFSGTDSKAKRMFLDKFGQASWMNLEKRVRAGKTFLPSHA